MKENLYHYRADLVRVIDGDTIVCDLDLGCGVWLKGIHLQLKGIKTAEVFGEDKGKGEQAKEYLESLLAVGKLVVKTDRNKERDSFKRLLGEVCVGKRNINQELIDEGYAVKFEN